MHISTLLGAQCVETEKNMNTIYIDSKNKIMYRDTCTMQLQIHIIFEKLWHKMSFKQQLKSSYTMTRFEFSWKMIPESRSRDRKKPITPILRILAMLQMSVSNSTPPLPKKMHLLRPCSPCTNNLFNFFILNPSPNQLHFTFLSVIYFLSTRKNRISMHYVECRGRAVLCVGLKFWCCQNVGFESRPGRSWRLCPCKQDA